MNPKYPVCGLGRERGFKSCLECGYFVDCEARHLIKLVYDELRTVRENPIWKWKEQLTAIIDILEGKP